MFLASALKCWRCSSDITNADFCKDPFDESKLTKQQKLWAYVECSTPSDDSNLIVVCKKAKQSGKFYKQSSNVLMLPLWILFISVDDRLIITRSCFWENEDTPRNACMNTNTPSYIKMEFCETCSTDGCNKNF